MDVEENKFFGLCKCCLQDGCFRSLWVEYVENGILQNYGKMLNECFSLRWQEPEYLHLEQICDDCSRRTADAYSFRKLLLSSQKQLMPDDEPAQFTEILDTESGEIAPIVKDEACENSELLDFGEYEEVEYLDEEYEKPELKMEVLDTEGEECVDDPDYYPEVPVTTETKWRPKKGGMRQRTYSFEAAKRGRMSGAEAYNVPRKPGAAGLPKHKRGESSQDNGTKKPDTESVSSGVLGHQKTQDEASPYKCGYCTYTTRYKINYTRHERHHIHDKTSMCKGTLHTAEKNQAKKREREGSSEKRAAIRARVNYKEQKLKSARKGDVNCQKKIHTEGKPFKCTHCSYTCASKGHLNRHVRTHTGEKPFKCTYCSYRCARKGTLTIHERMHTGEKPFNCTYCIYSFASKCDLTRHVRTHTGEKPFKCAYCSYRTARKPTLTFHERSHTGDKPFKCAHCSYSSARKSKLIYHVRVHTGDKPYKCAYCSYRCALKGALNCHEKTHTGEKPFKCTFCSYSSIQKSKIKCHERTHTGEKPYKCTFCSHSFAQKGQLKCHVRTHTGEKPYKCTYCSYSTAQKATLNCHETIHTREKLYKCAYCTYSCTQKLDLESHESIHGDRPFKCTHCNYSCARKSNLKVHETIHSSEKPYQCAHCKYSCRRKSFLKKHLSLHCPAFKKIITKNKKMFVTIKYTSVKKTLDSSEKVM